MTQITTGTFPAASNLIAAFDLGEIIHVQMDNIESNTGVIFACSTLDEARAAYRANVQKWEMVQVYKLNSRDLNDVTPIFRAA